MFLGPFRVVFHVHYKLIIYTEIKMIQYINTEFDKCMPESYLLRFAELHILNIPINIVPWSYTLNKICDIIEPYNGNEDKICLLDQKSWCGGFVEIHIQSTEWSYTSNIVWNCNLFKCDNPNEWAFLFWHKLCTPSFAVVPDRSLRLRFANWCHFLSWQITNSWLAIFLFNKYPSTLAQNCICAIKYIF